MGRRKFADTIDFVLAVQSGEWAAIETDIRADWNAPVNTHGSMGQKVEFLIRVAAAIERNLADPSQTADVGRFAAMVGRIIDGKPVRE